MNGLVPSGSTLSGAALGIPASIIMVWAADAFGGIHVPGEVGAAIGALLSSLVGYFFSGGKRVDTQ
jgi:hypothetical protein